MSAPRLGPLAAAPALAALLAVAAPAEAEPAAGDGVVVAARAIPSRTVLGAGDLALAETASGAGLARVDAAIGLETRVALYPGRPVRAEDLGPPALIERNDLVELLYRKGGLVIRAEGRALDRGGAGERVRIMNLGSRRTVTGRVAGPSLVEVSP
ncbi:MAG: flagellar basal body P-ring formation chaperone FlgA [Paracoccaceae bacterium]